MEEYLWIMCCLMIVDVITDRICQLQCAKKSKYNCEDCKNWRCLRYHCDKKREKLESEKD